MLHPHHEIYQMYMSGSHPGFIKEKKELIMRSTLLQRGSGEGLETNVVLEIDVAWK